ncbi:MAG: AAA family ATPase, partial [bacterium]
EQIILANKLLNDLANIAPVRITRGNHDCRRKNLKRTDSIEAIVNTLNSNNVIYYDQTKFYEDENVIWAVWHHGENKNNPWKTKAAKTLNRDNKTVIDLFHDPVSGSYNSNDFQMNSSSYYKINQFKGDYSFLGDIHRMQYLDKKKTKAYSGSLIAQDVDEGDDEFHGYLLWDIKNGTSKEIEIKNDYSFKNIQLTPYTDFDDLDFEIENPTKFMKVRFIWNTLPQTRSVENERKLLNYVHSNYENVTILHKNNFIVTDKVEVNNDVTLTNINNKSVQQNIFKEYLDNIGSEKDVIDDVIKIDEEITNSIDINENTSIEWSVIKFGGVNFMSYEKLDIDWRDLDGIFQITGVNTAGKTTIMKLLTYILFGRSLETDSRAKFGDSRFVNNRNNAKQTKTYAVIEANGEYFGIKRKTDINTTKDGTITGSPTVVTYYLLSDPDDELTDDNSIDKLDDDDKNKTQKKIDEIIGSYDNFIRVVMTTSDTLNRILSNDMSKFTDSLLFDSGLDIFDTKLEAFKEYKKKVNSKNRISCNVDETNKQINSINAEIEDTKNEIKDLESDKLPTIKGRISKGEIYIEDLTKRLHNIDDEISNLDVGAINDEIDVLNNNITSLNKESDRINKSISLLKESYDEVRLNELIEKRDNHKKEEYDDKIKIKNIEQKIRDEEYKIEVINGDIFRLKNEGVGYKKEIQKLKESKTCPTCGQPLDDKHQNHINEKIEETKTKMYDVARQIKTKENIDKKQHADTIDQYKKDIDVINDNIKSRSMTMETVLNEIGELTNDKNDVEKRKELSSQLEQIPLKVQNNELKIKSCRDKINAYNRSKEQILENKKTMDKINKGKLTLNDLRKTLDDINEDILLKKTLIGDKQSQIKTKQELIKEFKEQEYRDKVMELYKKCVHRDGIPRQLLINYILPKINTTLQSILDVADFDIWLDEDSLRPKLTYSNRPESVIDCISASGKERTFASVVLKYALNQINSKSKPTMFLLDEIMGKLSEESVEEFNEILKMIKNKMKKVLIIEHHIEINPDYFINVTLDDNGLSSLEIQ